MSFGYNVHDYFQNIHHQALSQSMESIMLEELGHDKGQTQPFSPLSVTRMLKQASGKSCIQLVYTYYTVLREA